MVGERKHEDRGRGEKQLLQEHERPRGAPRIRAAVVLPGAASVSGYSAHEPASKLTQPRNEPFGALRLGVSNEARLTRTMESAAEPQAGDPTALIEGAGLPQGLTLAAEQRYSTGKAMFFRCSSRNRNFWP